MNIPILFEDESFLVVNKPAGLPTQATVDKSRDNLYDLLLKSKRWSYLGLHHRLDAPTSGLVLLTKQKSVNEWASRLFKDKLIHKTYHALCFQTPKDEFFKVTNYLKETRGHQGKKVMKVTTSGGDFAETHFKVLEFFSKSALIQAQPLTGRMHQIRVHLNEVGHPILGDSLYFRADRKYSRLMLHAYELKWLHPNQQEVTVTASYPDDFTNALKRLRTKNGEFQSSI